MFKLNPISGQMDLVREISDNPEANTVEQSASTVATATIMDAVNAILNEKKVYHVFLTQAGTAAPTAAVLKDTVEDVVISRSAVGTSLFTKIDGFPMDKSTPKKTVETYDIDGNRLVVTHVSKDVYKLETYAAADTTTLADDVLVDQEFKLVIFA